jgi:ubiquinone/menaquinone biosynthesis C-methylase UbiE
MWLFSRASVIYPERDRVQRRLTWQILRAFLKPAPLFSDNIVVKARKRETSSDLQRVFAGISRDRREKVYLQVYEDHYQHQRQDMGSRMPSARRRQRIETYCKAIGGGKQLILELGCGVGDLTYALGVVAHTVIGSDISSNAVKLATSRKHLWRAKPGAGQVVFTQMNATDIAFPDSTFDAVVSTSMIEHLHPDDVRPHLHEVWRVLKPKAKYVVWCPNALGHHGDRDVHLSMFSYRQLMAEMNRVGFGEFSSFLFNRFPFGVDAKWKVLLEEFLTQWKIKILWSHLGVRNVLLVGRKHTEASRTPGIIREG